MREFPHSRGILVANDRTIGWSFQSMCERRERNRVSRHERHSIVLSFSVIESPVAPRLVPIVVHVCRPKSAITVLRRNVVAQRRCEDSPLRPLKCPQSVISRGIVGWPRRHLDIGAKTAVVMV